MPFENGVNWKPLEPEKRGRHATFGAALDAALKNLLIEKNEFFDLLVDRWHELFPTLPIRPGRYEAGFIFLYVRSAAHLYAMRPKLRLIKAKLAELPNAPKKIELRMEIHAK